MSPHVSRFGWLPALLILAGPVIAGDLNLTVYNNNLALVRDSRTFALEEGENDVEVADVSALLDPTSVHLTGEGIRVLEQNFEYDLASADRILKRYLDQTVTAVLEGGDAFTGRLVNYSGGSLVLVADSGVMVLSRERMDRIDFPELPGGLRTRPTLVWRLSSESAGERAVTLSYLTNGMQWHAEYVALVNEDDTALDLSAWVSLENNSGASYEDATLQLVAGDVHRAVEPMDGRRREYHAMAAKAPEMAFEEESLFEYHLYSLNRPVTVKDRQTKQVTLFPTTEVEEIEKIYRYRGGEKVGVTLEFKNAKSIGLGMPLPRGKLRVFKGDSKGGAQFIGEDFVDHTPKDETIELLLGNAFDLAAERAVLDHRKISSRVTEETIEVKLRNHKDEAVEIIVEERLHGDWKILSSTHDHEKESAWKVEFRVPIEPDGESVLNYVVRFNR